MCVLPQVKVDIPIGQNFDDAHQFVRANGSYSVKCFASIRAYAQTQDE